MGLADGDGEVRLRMWTFNLEKAVEKSRYWCAEDLRYHYFHRAAGLVYDFDKHMEDAYENYNYETTGPIRVVDRPGKVIYFYDVP